MADLKITVSGQDYRLDLETHETILEAALRQKVDAPYSCLEGVCTSCMAIVKEGSVDLPEGSVLSVAEQAEGKTLTCQAKIRKGCHRIAIDYDAI